MEIQLGVSSFPRVATYPILVFCKPLRNVPFKATPGCESVVVVKILEKLPRETRAMLSPDALACLVTARNISLSILISTRALVLPAELRSVYYHDFEARRSL